MAGNGGRTLWSIAPDRQRGEEGRRGAAFTYPEATMALTSFSGRLGGVLWAERKGRRRGFHKVLAMLRCGGLSESRSTFYSQRLLPLQAARHGAWQPL
jgi:hypothetical protein